MRTSDLLRESRTLPSSSSLYQVGTCKTQIRSSSIANHNDTCDSSCSEIELGCQSDVASDSSSLLKSSQDKEKEDDTTQDEDTERNTSNGAGVAVGQALLMKLFPELRAPLQEAMSDARETMKSISSPWWTVCNDASITNEQWQAAVAVVGLNIKERNKREDTTVALRFIQWLNNEPQRALRQTLESTLGERLAEIEKLGARASQRRAARHMRFLKQIKDAERKDQETSDEAVTSLLDSCQEFVDKCVNRETNRRRESAEQLTSRLKLGQDT